MGGAGATAAKVANVLASSGGGGGVELRAVARPRERVPRIKQSEKEQSRLVHECSCGVVTYRIELNKSEVMIL